MSAPAKRIEITLPSGEQITVHGIPKNKIKKALLESVLPTQVPDAEVLLVCDTRGIARWMNQDALERVGFTSNDVAVLPDVIAYSKHHDTVFLIEAVHGFDSVDHHRLAELNELSKKAKHNVVIISVLVSREVYVSQMNNTEFGTHVWFTDTPDRSVFLSDSPEASEQYRKVRLSARP